MTEAVCPINIDQKGQRARAIMGVFMLFDAVALVAVLILFTDTPRELRYISFILFFGGFLGLLQARGKTCVVLAAAGKRAIDGKMENVSDREESSRLRKQAAGTVVISFVLAAVSASIAYSIF